MDQIKENLQKVIIAASIVLVIFFIVSALTASEQNTSIFAGSAGVITALETFNFKSNFGLFLLFLSLFLGVFSVYLFEFVISVVRDEFGGVIYMAKNIGLRNHYIVCGGGRIGERVAWLLKERGKQVLIIENDESRAMELKRLGFKVLKENSLDEKSFVMANTKRAKMVFAALGQDVDNFIVVLNAKEANKEVKVITRCNSLKNINKFRELGAAEVVLPEIVGADRMVYLSEKENKK
ncbi:NAD-binding protein [Candidatus Parvarchaeota archaeon]|nr:NAD-binding protein [Candidatus Parvarchaeota archaeon]